MSQVLWTLIIGTVATVIFLSFIRVKTLKYQKSNEPPKGIVLFFDGYISVFEKIMLSITNNRLHGFIPYLFTLFNFILIMSIISIFSFVPAGTSILYTFTLGIISFIGIYFIGIATNGVVKFAQHKYKNPLEIFTQFAPLLSLSIRLFAATLATYIIGEILQIAIESILNQSLFYYPIYSASWTWGWALVDIFLAVIQAFVFVSLTATYWSMEMGPSWSKEERVKYYDNKKKQKTKSKKQ